jgi:SAM-dependent methyltransferase
VSRWLSSLRRSAAPASVPADVGSARAARYPRARGYISHVEIAGRRLTIVGWMLLPDGGFDDFQLLLNGRDIGPVVRVDRDDVQRAFPWIPDARRSGFGLRTSLSRSRLRGWLVIDVIGMRRGVPAARLSTWHRDGFRDGIPDPPAELMQRVAGIMDPVAYWSGGLENLAEFLIATRRYSRGREHKRLLDWGCGCGRLTSLFLRYSGIPEIHGCDVDREAVSWCALHLPEGRFQQCSLEPPTPYPDAHFDLILAYSVFTHLRSEVQLRWLQELRRILAPGGLLLATVHGEFASQFAVPEHARERVQAELALRGISDSCVDSALEGVAPPGYYRGVYQTRTYTTRHWSGPFRVAGYEERSFSHLQDLVVLE